MPSLFIMKTVLKDIEKERIRQSGLGYTAAHDMQHTQADWEGIIDQQVLIQRGENRPGFRQRMVRVAAVAIAAIQAHDRGGECID